MRYLISTSRAILRHPEDMIQRRSGNKLLFGYFAEPLVDGGEVEQITLN